MEPNDDSGRVPGVDFTIGQTEHNIAEFIPLTHEVASAILPFEEFYREQRDAIGRALALTLRDTQLAAEAVDEAMARAFQRWSRVQALDNPGGWVYRVGLNWSRSILRRALRPAPVWVTHRPASGDAGSVDPMIEPTIDRALAQLSFEQRAVVVCRLLIGYSEAQTAAALGIRPGTVKSRLARGTTRLQSLLSPLDPANKDAH
ncbi:MAG: sigma factor-like helix-turn-helix DNA-binding protein [Ilumatobacteraceae bacterium]